MSCTSEPTSPLGRLSAAVGRGSSPIFPAADGPTAFPRRLLTSLVVLGLLLLSALSQPALAQEAAAAEAPERIAGHVVQGTQGADLPQNLEVSLRVVDASETLVEELRQSTDGGGAFAFEDFPHGEEYRYRLGIVHNGRPRTVRLEDTSDPGNVDLTIFETTSSLESLSVTTQVMMAPRIDEIDRRMAVLELIQLENSGDHTFVANIAEPTEGMPALLRFGLPPGYRELAVESDLPPGNILEIDRGFALSNPVPPGEFRVVYRYVAPYAGNTLRVDRSLPLGANEFRVLIPQDRGKVTGEGLAPTDDAQLGETTYSVMRGSEYGRGSRISLAFSSLPEPSTLQRLNSLITRSQWVTLGLPVIVAAVMATIVAYVLFRRRRGAARTQGGESVDRHATITEIAALDDRYDAGELTDREYRRLRDRLVEQAVAHGASARAEQAP